MMSGRRWLAIVALSFVVSACGSKVDVARLTELVTDAWRMRAPAALARELDPGGPTGNGLG